MGEPEADPPFDLGRFRILERLGRGGMGVVYRAEDSRLKRMVAIKLLPRALEKDDARRERLLREARSAAAVTHPNVATVHEVGEEGGRAFIVMELVEGTTLRRVLEAGRLPAAEVARIAGAIARALARAHEKGVVHRDLKPDNVMLDRDREVKVLDFGLAKLRDEAVSGTAAEDEATETALTQEGAVLGTPGYMSPEQLQGRPADARTDVFAFGIVLYEMATGVRPFRGTSTMEVAAQVQRDEPERPSKIEPGVDRRIEQVIARCLAKRPADRFANGGELAAALESAAALPQPKSGRLPLAVAGLAAAVVAGVLVFRSLPQTRAPAAASSAAPTTSGSAPALPWWDDSPETSSNPEANKALKEGMRSLREGTGLANIRFRRAIELDPEFATPRVRLLASIACSGDLRDNFVKLVGLRDRLNARDRSIVEAYVPACQQNPPDMDEASRRFADVARRFPDDPLVIFSTPAETPGDQVKKMDRLIAIDPECAAAYGWRGGALDAMGDKAGAQRSYARCLELSPGALMCQTNLVESLGSGDDCGRLEKEARRATLMGTEYQEPYVALASALLAQGSSLDAVGEVFKQARTKHPNPGVPPLSFHEVHAQDFAGDFAGAARAAEEMDRAVEASSRERDHGLAAQAMVEIAEETGDLRGGAAVAKRFLSRRGGWEPATFDDYTPTLRVVLRASGAMTASEAARMRDRELARMKPSFGPEFGAWLSWVVEWAAGVRTPEDAREALAAMPDAAPARLRMGVDVEPVGRTLLLGGRVDEAVPWLETAAHACDVLADPFHATRAHLWLGEAREQKGDKGGACAEYAIVLDRWGHARPKSITADEARAHGRSLGCAAR